MSKILNFLINKRFDFIFVWFNFIFCLVNKNIYLLNIFKSKYLNRIGNFDFGILNKVMLLKIMIICGD